MIQYDQHHGHIQIRSARTRDEAIALSPLTSELAYAHRMGVADAKAHFSHVVSAAEERGESTVIVRYGKPVALVTPLPQKAPGIARAKGKLAAYADAQKRELEAGAFERAMVNKHADAS